MYNSMKTRLTNPAQSSLLLCCISSLIIVTGKGAAVERAEQHEQTEILRQLQSADVALQFSALRLLVREDALLHDIEPVVVPLVARAARSMDPAVRENALFILNRMVWRQAPGVMEALRSVETNLISALSSPSSDTRSGAASLLARMEPTPTNAIPALLSACKRERDARVRGACFSALGSVGRADHTVLEELLQSISSSRDLEAIAPIEALKHFNRYADRVVAAMLPRLDETNYIVVDQVVDVMDVLGASPSVPVKPLDDRLTAIVGNPAAPEDVRRRAVSAIAKLIDRDSSVADKLVNAIRGKVMPGAVRGAVLQALEHAGTPSTEVLEYIRDGAQSESEGVRMRALETLRNIEKRE